MKRDRSPRGVGVAVGLALAATFLLPATLQARRVKSVFKSQPAVWSPHIEEVNPNERLLLSPAWTFNGLTAPLAGAPVAAGRILVVAGQDGEVAGLDAVNGIPTWRVRLDGPIGVGPTAGGEVVYVATGTGLLHALDVPDGARRWSVDLGTPAVAAPAVLDGLLLVATAAPSLVSLDLETGAVQARLVLPGPPSTPPVVAGGSIFLGTQRGVALSIDAATLKTRWRHDAGAAVSAPLLVAGKRVYLATADRLIHCLRLKDGKRRWTQRTGAITTARMFVMENYLYVLCYDNDIYVLQRRNGHLLHRMRLEHRLSRDPGVTTDHLFVVPFAEGAVVGLSLPGLRLAGRYALDIPGEAFTTAPVVVGDRVAIGYGRSTGRVLALGVTRKGAAPDGEDAPGAP